MVSSHKRILQILVVTLTTVVLMGCGGDNGVLKGLSSLNPNPVGDSKVPGVEQVVQCASQKSLSGQKDPFNTSRIVHHPTTQTELQAFGAEEVKITSKEEYVALKKANCLLSADWFEIVAVTSEPPIHPSMKRHAFSFRVKKEISLEKLEALAKAERCLLSISVVDGDDDRQLAASDWTGSDPHYSQQTWLDDIKLPEALDEFFHKDYGINQDVVVADIDTGVYTFHEDLGEENLWKQSNGLIGYNVLAPSTDAIDDLGVSGGTAAHGSKIAGIIGALSGNDKGVMGMFPKNIKVMAVKYISSTGGAKAADRINGFEFAASNGADVINLSIGFSNNETTFRQMIEDYTAKGGFVAVSAGNDGALVDVNSPRYPVIWAKDIDGLMSVGASQSGSLSMWSGSNYGPQTVEMIAPGGSIFTTIPWNNGIGQWGNFYGSTSGTSFSGPMVAAAGGMVIGLLKSHNISFTAKDIEDLLATGSRKVTGFNSYAVGGRFLDMTELAKAVFAKYPEIKNGQTTLPDVPPPVVVCP